MARRMNTELYRLTLVIPDVDESAEDGELTWTTEDQSAAEAEGWALFDSDKYGVEIEMDDEMGVHHDDIAAIRFITEQADAGSSLHNRALAIHYANAALRAEASR